MDDDQPMPARRFHPMDAVVVATTTLFAISRCIATGLDAFDDLMRAHANYRRERADFARTVRDQIEGL